MAKHYSGENCPKTGKYSEYNKSGTLQNSDIDVAQGDKFPPTKEKGSYFQKQGK